MTLSLRLDESDAVLIKQYAALKGKSVSEVLRDAVLEQIEEEHDLHLYEKAMKEFKEDPTTYSQEEVEKMLGLK